MKPISIALTQVMLGLCIVVLGAVFVAMPEAGAHRLAAGGIGEAQRLGIAAVEIIAGLCLMVPRGHVVGAAVLATLTVGFLTVALTQAPAVSAPLMFGARASAGHLCLGTKRPTLSTAIGREWAI